MKTIDGGVTWSQQTSGTTSNLKAIYFLDDNNGYAVGNAGTFVKTSDGGANWTAQSLGSYDLYSVLFTDQNHGYAGASVSVYTYTNSSTIVKELTNTKQDFMIYPNPFSNEFKIQLSIPDNSTAEIFNLTGLKIYNILGEKVHQQIITSAHELIDISSQPSGIYFVQIKSGEKIYNQKIVKE